MSYNQNPHKIYGGWFVWCPESAQPKFLHPSEKSAISEANRLAREFPGQRYIVLAPIGVAQVETPSPFRKFNNDDFIPF